MTDPLEAEIDRLFQLPPAELVEARNALADRLKRGGDKPGAARIKALKRAVPVAWALNQVHFLQPALLERAQAATQELRALQAQRGIDSRQLSASVDEQRRATHAVVDAGMRAWLRAGLSEAALQERKLLTTLQAWLAGKGEEPPGRMTQELEASGFDAFAGMTLPPPPAPSAVAPAAPAAPATPVVKLVPKSDAGEREAAERAAALERARQQLTAREQAAAAARERVRARAEEQRSARQAHDQVQASVRQLERQLGELRATLDEHARALARSDAALDDAHAAQTAAEAAAAAAREELARASR